MVNGRRKGHSFERDVANLLREVYPKAIRQLEYQEGFGYDIANTGNLRIQCKRYKDYAPVSKIDEAKASCGDNEIPILITKGDKKDIMVVMPFYFFKELIALYERSEHESNAETVQTTGAV